MLQFLPVFNGRTIAVRASGKLTHKDYQSFLPELEKQINELGKVSVLFELDNFLGWELEAAKDDFKFGLKHRGDLERVAIVGDKTWERWMTLMVKPFMSSGKVRYFNREDIQKAWDWLREPERLEDSADQLSPYNNITVAFDFSPYSKHAVKRGVELAKHYGVTLTLLNIVQEISPYPTYYGDSMTSYVYDSDSIVAQNKERLSLAKKELDNYISTLKSDVRINAEVLSGDVNSTILSYIEAQESDLIIFGATKKKGLTKLMGTTPRYIQSHANCEILTVPLISRTGF